MKKHFTTTRILSGLLSAAMVVTMAPQSALSSFAAEPILEESPAGEEDSASFDAGAPVGEAESLHGEGAGGTDALAGEEGADGFLVVGDVTVSFANPTDYYVTFSDANDAAVPSGAKELAVGL